MLPCLSRSLTTCRSAPPASSHYACAWRMSWKSDVCAQAGGHARLLPYLVVVAVGVDRSANPWPVRSTVPSTGSVDRDGVFARGFNANTGEFAVQVGTEAAVRPPLEEGWQSLVHLHPNPENVIVHRLPAPMDVALAERRVDRLDKANGIVHELKPDAANPPWSAWSSCL